MKLLIVVLPNPVFRERIFSTLGNRENSLVEVKLSGKVVKLAVCDTFLPYPVEEILDRVERVKRDRKASGILCITGQGQVPDILNASLNRGYRIHLFYPIRYSPFLYGSGIVDMFPYRDFNGLLCKMEEVLS